MTRPEWTVYHSSWFVIHAKKWAKGGQIIHARILWPVGCGVVGGCLIVVAQGSLRVLDSPSFSYAVEMQHLTQTIQWR
jgi:hypothetical protein